MVRKVYKPPRIPLSCMAGEKETTVQDYVNQTVGKADGPGLARPASAPLGGQAGQTSEIIVKRVVLAVIKAAEERDSFVLSLSDVVHALMDMIEDEEEEGVEEIEGKLYDLLHSQGLKYIYYIHEDEGSEFNKIVISPFELDDKQLYVLKEIASLLSEYKSYHKVGLTKAINKVINDLVRKWSRERGLDGEDPAYAAFVIAKEYDLAVDIVSTKPTRTMYSIGNTVFVEKHGFCKRCSCWAFVKDVGESEGW